MSEKYKPKNINNTIKNIDTDNIHVRDIRNLINSDSITTDELIKESKVLDKDILEKIKSYKDLDIDYNDWKDLPPLQKNRTDLYFFGQPGSGKTCILASLFYYAHQKGLIKDNQSNREGSIYRDTLINGVKKGILAEGTPTDGVNYIPLDLTNPTNKRIHIALTYIFGIGPKIAGDICSEASIDITKRVNQLNEDEVNKIREVIESKHSVEGDLRRKTSMDIKRLTDLGCYRGLRHRKKLPVRGQRTHTNARTRKGKAVAIAGKKKVTKG